MFKFDTHTHSEFSVDGSESIANMCNSALKMGLSSLAITDHYELPLVPTGSEDSVVNEGYTEIKAYSAQSPVKLLCGIELGGIIYDTATVSQLLDSHAYDIVIGSLHGIAGKPEYYELDYRSFDYTPLLENYFSLLYKQALTGLFDVMAHLDYPTRYIRRMGLPCSLAPYSDTIDMILKTLSQNGKALEINCSGLYDCYRQTLPVESVIRRFHELGGEYVTIASDAHKCTDICRGFERGVAIAKDCGFRYITYFENRQAIPVKIND